MRAAACRHEANQYTPIDKLIGWGTALRFQTVFAACFIAISSIPASAQSSGQDRAIPGRLDCSELRPGKAGAFTSPLNFTYERGILKAQRKLISAPGAEDYSGTIDALGRIKVSGIHDESGRAWALKFGGQLSDSKPTILNGSLDVTSGAVGHRDCKITFLDKPADLLQAFSPQ
jgi:hypothetical protein